LKWVGVVVVVAIAGVAGFFGMQVRAFNRSVDRVYDIAIPNVTRSTDPAVLARGEHLAHSIAACATRDCHGSDMGGGRVIDAGPIGTFAAPNVTLVALAYSDGELARLIRHGVKRDGRTVLFMPSQDFSWLPDDDVTAIVSWIRSLPQVSRTAGSLRLTALAKFLDRRGSFVADVARRIDHSSREAVPAPAPTVEYGRFIGRLCVGCHGEHLSGGRIPGTPASMAAPLNLTPDASGLRGWTYEDFARVVTTGIRRNGQHLDAMMPIEVLTNMNDTERRALFAYLQSVPPRPFGGR
jgi:hypothetical protein